MLGAASTVAFSLLSVISPTGQAVAQQENPQCYSATLYGDADVNNFHINSDGTPLVKDFGSRLNTDYGNSDAYGVFNQDGRAGLDSIIRGGGKNNLKPDQKRTVIISVSKEMMKKPESPRKSKRFTKQRQKTQKQNGLSSCRHSQRQTSSNAFGDQSSHHKAPTMS